jgi:hypothetical protein
MSMRRFLSVLLLVCLAFSGCTVRVNRVHPKWNLDQPWEKTPITVEWTAIDRTFDSAINRAIDTWNHAVGCQVLVKASDPATANVKMGPYEGVGCGKIGISDIDTNPFAVAGTWRCSATSAEIKFRQMADLQSMFTIYLHELGHLLGLAHDDSVLMSPTPPLYDPAAFGAKVPALLPYPAEADAALVASRYCQK